MRITVTYVKKNITQRKQVFSVMLSEVKSIMTV